MPPPTRSRIGNVAAMVRVMKSLPLDGDGSSHNKREMVAEFCRVIGAPYSRQVPQGCNGLSQRHVQTLQRLLEGDSEKQIASRFGVSPHTVHVYVKSLYRHFGVSSRGELLARFVRRHPAANPPSPE